MSSQPGGGSGGQEAKPLFGGDGGGLAFAPLGGGLPGAGDHLDGGTENNSLFGQSSG